MCRYKHANLARGCMAHDKCYETLGKTKRHCDQELRTAWQKACKATVVEMSNIQRSSEQGERAYESAQRDAQRDVERNN